MGFHTPSLRAGGVSGRASGVYLKLMSISVDRALLAYVPGATRSRRIDCPFCCPGGRGECRTMAILDSERGDCIILYCHRASCSSHELSATGGGIKLSTYLRQAFPEIYKEDYRTALRAEARGVAPKLPTAPALPNDPAEEHLAAAQPEILLEYLMSELPSAFSLPEDHPARVYVEQRRLPKEHANLLRWDETFGFTAGLIDGQDWREESRLVIPYMDATGTKLTAVLGRSIDPRGSASTLPPKLTRTFRSSSA